MKLLFDESASETNNNFNDGVNVTVRRGTKYNRSLYTGTAAHGNRTRTTFLQEVSGQAHLNLKHAERKNLEVHCWKTCLPQRGFR